MPPCVPASKRNTFSRIVVKRAPFTSQIWRALDFLTEQGFIHKIESSNAFLLCHHFEQHHPAQLLICDQCGHVDELHSSPLQQEFVKLASEKGFLIQRQTVEAHGSCQSCLKKAWNGWIRLTHSGLTGYFSEHNWTKLQKNWKNSYQNNKLDLCYTS